MARPSTFSLMLGKAMVNAISTTEIRDEAAKTVLFKVDVVDVAGVFDVLPPS